MVRAGTGPVEDTEGRVTLDDSILTDLSARLLALF